MGELYFKFDSEILEQKMYFQRTQRDKSVQKNKPLIMFNVVESSLESPLGKGQRRAER